MLVRITPAMQDYLADAMSDAVAAAVPQGSSSVYLKIHQARQAATTPGKTVTIVATASELLELASRADNEVGRNGICDENIGWSSGFSDKAYWLGRKRAYKALLDQVRGPGSPAPENRAG